MIDLFVVGSGRVLLGNAGQRSARAVNSGLPLHRGGFPVAVAIKRPGSVWLCAIGRSVA
jgi:hypothetical protein